MGRPSNTGERQAQIVDAAIAVFAAHGYEAASVADVARAAGLTPGLVHYHFDSKQQILVRVVARLGEELEARVSKRLARAGAEAFARLDAFVDAHLALDAEANPALAACWTVVGAESVRQEPVRAAYAQVVAADVERLEALVRACAEERGNSPRSVKSAAAAIFASIQGYFTLASAAPGLVPKGSASRQVKRLARALCEEGS